MTELRLDFGFPICDLRFARSLSRPRSMCDTSASLPVEKSSSTTRVWPLRSSPVSDTVPVASTAPAAATPPSKGRVFARRLFSTVILWTVVLTALFSNYKLISNYVFLLIMLVLAGLGLAEFYGLVEKRGLVCFKTFGIVGGLLLMFATFARISRAGSAAPIHPRGSTILKRSSSSFSCSACASGNLWPGTMPPASSPFRRRCSG